MTPVLEAWLLPALFLTVLLAGAVRPGGEVSVALLAGLAGDGHGVTGALRAQRCWRRSA